MYCLGCLLKCFVALETWGKVCLIFAQLLSTVRICLKILVYYIIYDSHFIISIAQFFTFLIKKRSAMFFSPKLTYKEPRKKNSSVTRSKLNSSSARKKPFNLKFRGAKRNIKALRLASPRQNMNLPSRKLQLTQ